MIVLIHSIILILYLTVDLAQTACTDYDVTPALELSTTEWTDWILGEYSNQQHMYNIYDPPDGSSYMFYFADDSTCNKETDWTCKVSLTNEISMNTASGFTGYALFDSSGSTTSHGMYLEWDDGGDNANEANWILYGKPYSPYTTAAYDDYFKVLCYRGDDKTKSIPSE